MPEFKNSTYHVVNVPGLVLILGSVGDKGN